MTISTESAQVKTAITDIYSSLEKMDSINLSQAKVYTDSKEELINVLESKIPALIKSMKESAGSEMKEQIEKATVDYDIFESKCKTELYRLAQVIAEKTSHSGNTAPERNLSKSDAIHLKKADPPTFSGREEDYLEFHRKWLAVVGPAHLPEEAEIDRLREALPKDAEEMLIGVTKLSAAWSILKKRYGDEDLIIVKLKNELKALSIPVGLDHETMINLTIKVRSLVTRLKQLKAAKALKYDAEFVAAIYFQLPERYKQEWLKFDKSAYDFKWSALLEFLEQSYDKAVEEKLLLATLTPPSGSIGLAAAVIESDSSRVSNVSGQVTDKDADRKERYEEARIKAGRCPIQLRTHLQDEMDKFIVAI